MKVKQLALAIGMTAVAISAQSAPLKIAIVETLSGPQASTGLLYKTAINYQLSKINAAGGWNGEEIKIIEYDNQGGPAGASDKVKSAIADGADIIIQGSSSAVSGQITEDVRKHNIRNKGKEVLFLNMGGEALELTADKCHFHHFRFTTNAPIRVKTLTNAMRADGTLGGKVYSMNQNYSWGSDMEKAIELEAQDNDYEVVEKTLHDVNRIQDFAPYANRIKNSSADTVITGNWSNDLLLLMKSTRDAGLQVRFGTVFLDQPGNIANAGELSIGHYISHAFNIDANDESRQFAEDYKATTGHYPAYIEPQTVIGIQMLGEAINKTGTNDNNRININDLAFNLEKIVIDGPMGEVAMRADDHQVMLPIAVSKVSKDAKYKADDTDMGFELVKVFTGAEAVNPIEKTCNMKRPS